MEGGGNQNEACAGLFAHADSVCGTATATNDALAPACREATARALYCLRAKSTFMGPRARVVLECVAEHRRDPSPCNGLREDFERDTTHIREQAKLDEGWQKRMVELCEGPFTRLHKCHALMAAQGGEQRLAEVCEGPLDEMSACIQRVACPARLSAVRACLQSSGGREEVCEVEVDRWVGCTLNTAVESLRGLSGSRA